MANNTLHFRITGTSTLYGFSQSKPNVFSSLLNNLMEYLNATHEMVFADDEKEIQFENKTWTGMLGLMQSQKADLSLDFYLLMSERLDAIDFVIPPILTSEVGIISREDQPNSIDDVWDNFKLIDWQIWVLYAFSVLALSMFTFLFERSLNRCSPKNKFKVFLTKYLFKYIEAVLEEGNTDISSLASVRVMFWVFSMSVFLLTEYFLANLQTGLVVEAKADLINTLDDILKRPDMRIIIPNHRALLDVFLQPNFERDRQIGEIIRKHNESIVEDISCSSPKFRYIAAGTHVLFLDKIMATECSHVFCDDYKGIKFHVSDRPMASGPVTGIIGKHLDPVLKKRIGFYYQRMVEAGIIAHWINAYHGIPANCFKDGYVMETDENDENETTKWTSMQNFLRVLSIGLLGATIPFIIELISGRLKSRK